MLLPRASLCTLAALFTITGCGGKDDAVSEDSAAVDADGDGALVRVDCDDDDATVYPGAPESCDGRDEDCDGAVDEAPVTPSYLDADGDGYGDPNVAHDDCPAPEGYVQSGADCDDSSADISPDAAEICDEIDNNCDGRIDDEVWSRGAHRTLFDADIEMVGRTLTNSYFGRGLLNLGDIDGDGIGELVVSEDGPDDAGRVHLYRSNGAGWTASSKSYATTGGLTISEEAAEANFGQVMRRLKDLDGDGLPDLAVSAPGHNGGHVGSGEVLVFFSSGALLSTEDFSAGSADLVISGHQATGTLGVGLTSGDYDGDGLSDLAISDPKATGSGVAAAGVTYVLLSSGALATGASSISLRDADTSFVGELADDNAGAGLVTPGDIDGDGRDDLVISSPRSSAGGGDAGMIYILRSGGALATTTGTVDLSVADMRAWGGEVKPDGLFEVGDLDGDGLADLAIATSETNDSFYPGVGRVTALYSAGVLSVGAGDLDLSVVDLTILGEPDDDIFGQPAVSGGDLDGDGRVDLVISAAEDDRVGDGSGAIFVMTSRGSLRHPSGVLSAEDAELVISGDSPNIGDGLSVLILDDYDADGRAELVVGNPNWNISGYPEGEMNVFWGETVSDWLTVECEDEARLGLEDAALTTVERTKGNLAGASVAILDDLDGDGLSELVIGAALADEWGLGADADVGEVSILLSGGALGAGGAEVARDDADITIRGATNADRFGERIVATGDVEGDGLPDLLVLAPGVNYYDGTGYGVAYVFTSSGALASGSSSLTADDADIVFMGIEDGIYSIGDAGDVDGDGRSDLLFGAPETWSNGLSGGRAYLFLSSGALADGVSNVSLDDADHFFKGTGESSFAGGAATGVGDVDGDGLGDIVVTGMPDDVATAYLLLSSGALGSTKSAIELYNADAMLEVPGVDFDYSTFEEQLRPVSAGDLDGDGQDDIAVGAPGWSARGLDTGAVFLFTTTGTLSGLSGTVTARDADLTLVGIEAGGLTGDSVVSAQDMDGDGAPELIITAPSASERADHSGAVYVLRSGGALSTSGDTIDLADADLTLYGAALFDKAGTSVSAAGDVDGDGLDDLLIGAPADYRTNGRLGGATLVTSGQLIEHARR